MGYDEQPLTTIMEEFLKTLVVQASSLYHIPLQQPHCHVGLLYLTLPGIRTTGQQDNRTTVPAAAVAVACAQTILLSC